MEIFVKLTGTACPINQSNLNTDQILPARYLKCTRAMGFGKVLFHDLRFDAEGREKSDFPLNKPAWRKPTIVVSARNLAMRDLEFIEQIAHERARRSMWPDFT
jgi:3-isopropylmalate/(R)-2-methylmalate dehydratase small subunit